VTVADDIILPEAAPAERSAFPAKRIMLGVLTAIIIAFCVLPFILVLV